MADINKAAALCIRDKKLLVVKKKGIDEYISLGGTIEQNEKEADTIEREVMEEIGCKAVDIRHFETYEGLTHDGKKTLRIACYLCEIVGTPTLNPADAIEAYAWVTKEEAYKTAGMLRLDIIPGLAKRGLL